MKIISETLSGVRSFRGLGFLRIEGILYPVCGSRQFDLGSGSNVAYLDEQIKRLETVEPTQLATFIGRLISGNTANGFFGLVDRFNNRPLLGFGSIESIPLGLFALGSTVGIIPPLRDGFTANIGVAWDWPDVDLASTVAVTLIS